MRENTWKALTAAIAAGLLSYFGQLAIPVLMLGAVMVLDYATGLAAAALKGGLDSRTGLRGIVKKLCYLVLVVVGGCVDWLLVSGLGTVGIEYPLRFAFGMLITIWLILNELISILENLGEIDGFPLPAFLMKLLSQLKERVEQTKE